MFNFFNKTKIKNNSVEAAVVKISPSITINIIFEEDNKKKEKNIVLADSRLSWENLNKFVSLLASQIKLNMGNNINFDVIISIGRSGAVIGAILSDHLPGITSPGEFGRKIDGVNRINIPHYSIERYYDWNDGITRKIIDNEGSGDEYMILNDKGIRGKNILLVGGHTVHGGTMQNFYNKINKLSPNTLKTACLIQTRSMTFRIDFCPAVTSGSGRILMPWVSSEYIDDCYQEEVQ